MAAAPRQIGRYQVERVLGTGTFATVFLAYDDGLDARVALKVLAENWSFDDDVKRRFLEEARILWRAQHDRIVRVHLVDELDDGRPFFVMDYADRGTLHDRAEARFADGSTYGVDEAIAIAHEIAECLEVAHDLGIVHRDLKPSNILFRSTPARRSSAASGGAFSPEQIVLADFGLARRLEAMTNRTVVAGTPAYMAPEQADPERGATIDERVDVYSANAILYELLSGRPPYVGQSLETVREAYLRGEPEPLDRVRRDVPGALARVIGRGLERDPALRYRSAMEWSDALTAAIASDRRSSIVLDDADDPAARVAAACARLTSRFGDRPLGGAVASARERLHRALRVAVVGERASRIDALALELARAGQLEVEPIELMPGRHPGSLELPESASDAMLLVLPEGIDEARAALRALAAAASRENGAVVAIGATLPRSTAPISRADLVPEARGLLGVVALEWPAPADGAHETLVPGMGADAVLTPAFAGDDSETRSVTTRELRNLLGHLLVPNKGLLRADTGVAQLRRALERHPDDGEATSELRDELEALALQIPELVELEVLRSDVAGRLTLPPGPRGEMRRLLLERDTRARLGLGRETSADEVRESALQRGERWRSLVERAPYVERDLISVVARAFDRVWVSAQDTR